VESLVFAAQLRNIAEQLDIQVTDEEIDERLQQDIQQYYGGDRARYEQDLEKFGVTEADVREQLGLTLLQQKVQEKIYAEVDVTDEDLRTFYDENKANYATQDTRKVQFLLVSGEDTAREARAKLANGEPWNAVAREHALEPGPPSTGGSLDAQKGSLEANFEKAAFSLDTDELSQPVLVSEEYAEGSLAGKCKPDCYFLIRPTGDVVAGEQQSFESVKTSIRQSLEQQRKDEHLQARVKKLLDEQKRQTVYAPQYQPPKSADVSGGGGGDTAN
jgi:parvulin-like peptidyl-prolyl cis-trans isomerase-like protein